MSCRFHSHWLPALAAIAASSCLHPSAPTVQLQAFLGADEEGGYALAEVARHPGAPLLARRVAVAPDGRIASTQPLAPPGVEGALDAASKAGNERTAERTLGGMAWDGYRSERAKTWQPPAQLPATWLIEPIDGAAALLEVDRRAEGGLVLRLGLVAGARVALLALPELEGGGLDSVLLLPGGRLGLALFTSTSGRGAGRHRLEGASQLEIGRALSSLLDARAIDGLKEKDLAAARRDLEMAVKAAPDDAVARYNLACTLSLQGEVDPALMELGRAVDRDPTLKREALQDPDLDLLRERVEFKLMIEPRPGEE